MTDREEADRRYDAERRAALEAASIESGHAGIKALLILNGSACIAILGFLAKVFTATDMDTDRARFFESAIGSLIFFASGAGMSVILSFIAYLANQRYATGLGHIGAERDLLWLSAGRINRLALAIACVSIALFFAGIAVIYRALS